MHKFFKKFAPLLIVSAAVMFAKACSHKSITEPIAPLPASALAGQWKTIDDETGQERSIVEIYEEKGKYYGKIIRLLLPEDKGKICNKCEGEDKNRPVLGLVILKNISKNGNEYSGGTVLDPNNGKVYKCAIELEDNGSKIKLRGYFGLSIIGRTQYWYRVK